MIWQPQARSLELYEGTLQRESKADVFKIPTNFTNDPVLADYFTDLYEVIREAKCFMIRVSLEWK